MYLNQSGKTARSKTNRFSVYRHDKKRLPILIPEIPWYSWVLFIYQGYCTNFRISSRLGALSFDDSLARGSPLVIFSHGIGISDIHKLVSADIK